MSSNIKNYTNASMQGISMVEMLVALALGSFLMLGLSQIYVANQKTSMLQDDFSRVQENGRIGTEMLVREIRMADFRGCAPEPSAINSMLDTTDPDYDASTMDFLAGGVGGVNNVTSLTIGGKAVTPGSDTLILRGMYDACDGLGRMTGVNTSASFFLSSNDCDIDVPDIIVLANCAGGDMFTVTNRNFSNVTVVHNTGNNVAAGAIDNATKGFSQTYEPGTPILKPYQKTFFISAGVDGDSLFVNDTGTTMELVTNVTGFQVEFGEDTNADGSVDRYVDAATVSDFNEVKAVKVELAVKSGPDVSKTFTAVANIRNRM